MFPGQTAIDPSFAFGPVWTDEFKPGAAGPVMVKLAFIVFGINPIVLYVTVREQLTVSVGMTHDVEKLKRYGTFGVSRIKKNVPRLMVMSDDDVCVCATKLPGLRAS